MDTQTALHLTIPYDRPAFETGVDLLPPALKGGFQRGVYRCEGARHVKLRYIHTCAVVFLNETLGRKSAVLQLMRVRFDDKPLVPLPSLHSNSLDTF